jgi:thiamine biosynthesis lipoprotein
MGTVLDVRFTARTRRHARHLQAELLTELSHLERTFSIYDPASELLRWSRTGGDVSADLAGLLRAGLAWQGTSNGVFNPAIRALVEMWKAAETSGVVPDDEILSGVAEAIRAPAYRPDLIGPPWHDLDFNALAKGMAADLAARRLLVMGAASVMLNLGGEVVQLGDGVTRVGIENPNRPYDNEPPLAVVELRDGALATSGGHRRGFRVGQRWFSHVIDPRDGRPVGGLASVSITAPDAGTADVIATVVNVLGVEDGIGWIEALNGPVGYFLVTREGDVVDNELWRGALVR